MFGDNFFGLSQFGENYFGDGELVGGGSDLDLELAAMVLRRRTETRTSLSFLRGR